MGAVMTPIPRRLLGSTALVRVPKDGEYGGEFEEPVEIGHVRLQPAHGVRMESYRFTDPNPVGLLFVDAKNSEGAFEIPVGSLVSVDGADWASVRTVAAYPDFYRNVHHWEVELA